MTKQTVTDLVDHRNTGPDNGIRRTVVLLLAWQQKYQVFSSKDYNGMQAFQHILVTLYLTDNYAFL